MVILGRIFVNSETTEMYRHAFVEYHRLLQNEHGITLKWRHLDNTASLMAVVADQEPKQMAGKIHQYCFGTGLKPIHSCVDVN